MRGVQFGEKHSYVNWNLMLTSKKIGLPEPKKETIDIPGSDGELDFTESLTGDVKYSNRTLEFTFFADVSYKMWYVLLSEITNYLHGQRLKIILDDDRNFYYIGRAEVDQFNTDRIIGQIVIKCDVKPYKYDLTSSEEDWLWDPFSFEDGIINETNNIEINGEKEVIIYGRRKKVVPTLKVTSENGISVIFNSHEYNLSSGTQKVLDIQISEGKNVLKFKGKGRVSIGYRGGSL